MSGRRTEDDCGRYERLIAAAEAEFVQHGFAAANIGRIASSAGISKKTVYRHVSSKEALFIAVVEYRLEAPAHAIAHGVDLPLIASLTRFFESFTELSFSSAGIASHRLVLTEGARFPALARAYAGAVSTYGVEEVSRLLRRHESSESLLLPDVQMAARMLMSMVLAEPMRDAALGISTPPDRQEMRERITLAVTLFLDGAKMRNPCDI